METKKPRNLRDEIDPKDLEKIRAYQARTGSTIKVDDHWLLLTEFALAFGWQAYRDVIDDKIQLDEMMTMLEAKRKLDYLNLYQDARTAFIGAGSAQSKKPSQAFKTMTREFIKKAKAD